MKLIHLILNGVYPSRRKIEQLASSPAVIKEQAIRQVWWLKELEKLCLMQKNQYVDGS